MQTSPEPSAAFRPRPVPPLAGPWPEAETPDAFGQRQGLAVPTPLQEVDTLGTLHREPAVAAAKTPEGTAASIVTFGKHRGSTYTELLTQYPDYCDWVLDTAQREESQNPSFLALVKYLRQHHRRLEGQPSEAELISGSWLLQFGKYRGVTMKEVASKDGPYCEWLLGQVLHSTFERPAWVTRNMLAFVAYIQQMRLRGERPVSQQPML